MPMMKLLRTARCILACLPAGCGLLDVSDPTRIEEADITNGTSAVMMRAQALALFYRALPYSASYSGLLSDELLADPTPSTVTGVTADQAADRRLSTELEASFATNSWNAYDDFATVRWRAANAIRQLGGYAPPAVRAPYMGQMFAVRGFAEVLMAETMCPGFPLNEVEDGRVIPGAPLSTVQAFEHALAELDSAVVYAVDSAGILNFARVGRARALLGLGRFTEAAAAAEPVPTDYTVIAEYNPAQTLTNYLAKGWIGKSRSVADREGGSGLDFATAADPRLILVPEGKARDGVTDLYSAAKYPTTSAPIVIASGIEARLIQAEAALNGAGGDWLGILNDLRRTAISPALPDTVDPGTPDAQVDLLFRERAFWLFLTGHRLGDLRRLVRLYGRVPESVFPSGAYRLGDTYGTATSLPFQAAAEAIHNPAVAGCTGS